MKIIYLNYEENILKSRTGGSRYVLKVLNYLRGKNVEVRFLAPCFDYRRGKISCIEEAITFFRQFKKIDNSSKYIILEDYSGRFACVMFNFLLRISGGRNKVVLIVQGFCYKEGLRKTILNLFRGVFEDLITILFLKQVNLIIQAGGKAGKNKIKRFEGKDSKTKSVLPGTEPVFFARREAKEKKRSVQSKTNLLYVGRGNSLKGLEYLVQALSRLKDVEWNLVFVGDLFYDPSYGQRIYKMIEEYGLKERILFKGYIDNPFTLKRIYEESVIFVLSSVEECYPLVIVEALSVGLPVVSTNVGAITEMMENGKEGFIVPAKNPFALSKAIRTLLLDENLQIEMGKRAFVRGGQLLRSWEETGKEFYEEIQKGTRNY